MKAPAMPPAPAPMRARSKTVRDFMRVWALGLFLEVGLSQFGDLGVVEVEAKGSESRSLGDWVLMAAKWVKRLGKWTEFGFWWWRFGSGDGRPREAEILVSMAENSLSSLAASLSLSLSLELRHGR